MSTQDVVKLRTMTGAGMLDCKKALDEAGGDLDKAAEILRKKGQAKAAKKSAERETKEGIVHSYIHANSKVGVLIELLCETDFVARNEAFQELAHDLAMQIAATEPLYLKPEDVPQEVVEKEKSMIKDEMADESKPADVLDKIIEGKMAKYYEEICLMNQPFIKDEDRTIADLINDKIASIG
ncbi:translation elongation factor Ts, partial [Candidatus Saccharibacteria bacterium]|nr:translation elongation factor Ts [Candidatus Saccharibacteria bacterium]NIV03442.1 translation elongation factor Ts [Calditrichia bacterium]NIS38353.1 translation elongation factor Ts [Candidatus Saccharibacteria bacterium]NIV71711.1 translation elongation factor Ts [Calditrichia bacterium]NIV98384.1 translation elongation factor Ts [Candidatus Saccharibacteria bacterium]